MKLQTLAEQTALLLTSLRCPQCGAPLTLVENRSLVCERRHCFDLSTKGYVNLAPSHDQNAEKYDAELFQSRSRVFAGGFYAHVAQALQEAVKRFGVVAQTRATQRRVNGDRPRGYRVQVSL